MVDLHSIGCRIRPGRFQKGISMTEFNEVQYRHHKRIIEHHGLYNDSVTVHQMDGEEPIIIWKQTIASRRILHKMGMEEFHNRFVGWAITGEIELEEG